MACWGKRIAPSNFVAAPAQVAVRPLHAQHACSRPHVLAAAAAPALPPLLRRTPARRSTRLTAWPLPSASSSLPLKRWRTSSSGTSRHACASHSRCSEQGARCAALLPLPPPLPPPCCRCTRPTQPPPADRQARQAGGWQADDGRAGPGLHFQRPVPLLAPPQLLVGARGQLRQAARGGRRRRAGEHRSGCMHRTQLACSSCESSPPACPLDLLAACPPATCHAAGRSSACGGRCTCLEWPPLVSPGKPLHASRPAGAARQRIATRSAACSAQVHTHAAAHTDALPASLPRPVLPSSLLCFRQAAGSTGRSRRPPPSPHCSRAAPG